jgi:TPR repeat protein
MPGKLICCISLPPATITSVPIGDFAVANEGLENKVMEEYFSCCGKSICTGCVHSFRKSGNMKCPFCNYDGRGKTDEEIVEDLMKRVEANDAGATYVLGSYHYHGQYGLHQDEKKATKLWIQAAELGISKAHIALGKLYHKRGDLKKAKFRYEAAAMAGDEDARFNIGYIEFNSGNADRGLKHWKIAASSGNYAAMNFIRKFFEDGVVSRESIDSTLIAFNKSCVEMRSEVRDAAIRFFMAKN